MQEIGVRVNSAISCKLDSLHDRAVQVVLKGENDDRLNDMNCILTAVGVVV